MRKLITATDKEVSAAAKREFPRESGTRGSVLVVDDNRNARESIADAIRSCGHAVNTCSGGAEALEILANESYQCVITDLQMPGMDGIELIAEIKKRRISSRLLMLTAHASLATAIEAIRLGAFDYLEKPCDIDRLEKLVEQAIRHSRREHTPSITCNNNGNALVLIGSSPPVCKLRDDIRTIADASETVLITGESGTGKEVIARMIHANGPRCKAPFLAINCPAISPMLMESELFGHKKGAFTGADTERIGRFEAAGEGTLLLDEITEIDLSLQGKLLRVLQERSFERVGCNDTVRYNARVIATSNRNIETEIASGRFRGDLYYRLSILPIRVPPLRERKSDIPELISHFMEGNSTITVNDARKKIAERFDDAAVEMLLNYDWPGNVRELRNLVVRSNVFSQHEKVTTDDLRRWLCITAENGRKNVAQTLCILEGKYDGATGELRMGTPEQVTPAPDSLYFPPGMTLDEMERRLIESTLRQCGGHRGKTAETLKIGVRTLNGKLRQYGYGPREKVS